MFGDPRFSFHGVWFHLGQRCWDNQPNIWECGKEELAQGGDRGEGEMVKCVLGVGVGLGETFFKDRGQNQPLGLQPILG